MALRARATITKLLCFVVPTIILLNLVFTFWLWTKPPHNQHNVKDRNMKYILQWTKPDTIPFIYLESGQNTFRHRKCREQNCYVTADRNYFNSVTQFDAILFHGPEILGQRFIKPTERSSSQLYIYVCIESPQYYPDCSKGAFNNFFNWTWTFKLDSDVMFNYLTVRDRDENIIGPADNITWIQHMTPVDDDFKVKLRNKSKAAAWFVSNCHSWSGRETIAQHLADELATNNLTLDIYGGCGTLKCQIDSEECMKKIENDYYFYLSFENSFAPDYVTEKLLTGLKHHAVPVVLGGADYTRFMPDGIYLDIRKLGAREVAKRMNEAITNPSTYHDYFRWHNHYSYEETSVVGNAPDSDSYCRLCELIHLRELRKEQRTWEKFDEWWNRGVNRCGK